MTVDELIDACTSAIASGTGLILVIPGRAEGFKKRLCGRRGPLGEILCENREGNCVVRFDPKAVLRFQAKEQEAADA